MSPQYALHVYRVHDVVWEPKFHSRVPNLYVRARIDGIDRRTRTAKRNISPHWNESLTFSSAEISSSLNIQVKHASDWSSDPCVGYIDVTLSELLKECVDGEAQLILRPPHGKLTAASVGVLHYRLEAIGVMASVESNVKAAAKDIQQARIVGSANASDSTAVAITDHLIEQREQGEFCEALGSLVAKLDVLVGIIDEVSKVHPYLNAAWQVTSALYKGVSKQFKADKRIIDLVRAMQKAFEFANDAQSLPSKALHLEQIIIELLKQITECCLFVREYTSHGFARWLLESDSSKIGEFEQPLASLGEALNASTVIYTAFVSARMSIKVDSLFLRQALNPVQGNAFGRPTCLPGTRVEIQKHIFTWLLSEAKQNILWLNGVAGSGKSTLSTTAAEYFREISRLGDFMFFERGRSEPSSVIPTIAFVLASFDSYNAARVAAAVEQDSTLATASAKVQFEKLLLGPLSAGSAQGPVVIILDALDECGTPPDSQRPRSPT